MVKGFYGTILKDCHSQQKVDIVRKSKHLEKKKRKFSDKITDIFHSFAQNIDCGYSLEPPRRLWYSLEPPRWGGSNEYPQSMFLSRNKKYNVYPCKPQFIIKKQWGWRGSKLHRHVFVMQSMTDSTQATENRKAKQPAPSCKVRWS